MSTSRRTPLGAALGGLPATTAHAASWQQKRAPACETSPATFTHIMQTSGSLQDCYLLLSNLRGYQLV